MASKADKALKETNIENKKMSLKISKKDTSRKTKKVILEEPILEQFSPRKSNIKNKPEQNAIGSFSDVKKSNTSLKPVTPRPNYLKLVTDQLLLKPKKTLKLSMNNLEDSIEELPEETIFEDRSKKDISINQNSSFFYEPSIFEKFDIKVSTESNDTILEENNYEDSDFVSNETSEEIEVELEEVEVVENESENLEAKSEAIEEEYDFISTETPDIYKAFESNGITDTVSNNFFESSIPTVEETTSNSVFKEFSYNEEQNLPENEIVQAVSPFAILNQVAENKPAIENLENNENLNNNLKASAETSTLVLPSINEDILQSQEVPEASGDILTNIITPPANSNLEIDDIELSDEEVDKELDEILGIAQKKDTDNFSIEEYFGVTVNNNQEDTSSKISQPDVTSDFLEAINLLSKTISELENSNESQTPIASAPESTSEKAINILINKDDIFSISIANETYEIVTDFDGISVLSENIHISTPKNNFYVKIGEKYIEIHKQPDLFVVNTNFEDIEFANAINNVTFAKKKNKIELNIKEAFKISSINNKIELSMLNTSIANLTSSQNDSNENDESSVCDNKTLIINEENQKVYLPYTIEEVMKKLHNSSDYQSIQDVIDQEYTLPLSTFKMPIISRFKEAYRFMRVKEKSSIYAALDLAVELMFNSNLNPAIIRASKDLKELNIYLDCLYENELDKFDCFKIIYKVLPKIQ